MSSKSKGNRGERRIVAILNKHFETEEFGRVPASGGVSTFRKGRLSEEASRTLTGDLYGPMRLLISWEVKTGYDLDFLQIFDPNDNGDKKTIKEFLEQASGDALRIKNKIPCLLYTKDRRQPVLIIPAENHIRAKEITELLKNNTLTSLCFTIDNKHEQWKRWAMFNFVDFLNAFDRSFFFEDKVPE
jgi:hypothetical protein